MRVSGQAACNYSHNAEGQVRLSGDVLRFVFAEGEPQQIGVEGGVQGAYAEPSDAEAP